MEKKIIEIQCKKCGEKYDRNYKACPSCGFNPVAHTLKIMGIVLLVLVIILTFANSIYLSIKINDLEEQINNLTISSDNSNSEMSSLDLISQSYYATYEVTNENYEETTNALDSYILYFHQANCSFCGEANVFIDQYITLGYAGYLPVLFVTPDTGDELFTKYGIESTPSAVYVKDGQIVETKEGSDGVFELFDGIVAEANSEE